MYFLKFLKYYWEEKLHDPADRVMIPLFSSLIGSLPFIALSAIFNIGWFIGIYVAVVGTLLFSLLTFVVFQHYRKMYLEWQDQVFDTLRKDPRNPTDV